MTSHFRIAMCFGLGWVILATGCLVQPATEISGETSRTELGSASALALPDGPYRELIQDPSLTNGVAHGFANTLPSSIDSECSARWYGRSSALGSAKWLFWEIAEKTYFCENAETPLASATQLTFSSSDRSKQAIIPRNGSIRLLFDTSREWRKGCNLSLADGTALPRYPDRSTNWPHFLIGQNLEDPREGTRRLWLGRNRQLIFSSSVRLNESSRPVSENCPPGTWGGDAGTTEIPNHELFYAAVILRHRSFPAKVGQSINANQIYALIPMFYSEDGANAVSAAPWMNADQFGNVVYFAPGHPALRRGAWVDYAVDVDALTRETLGMLKERFGHESTVSDYYALGILIGWEIWGGFRNDVEVRDISLKEFEGAGPAPSPSPSPIPPPTATGEMLGGIDGIETASGRYHVWGWACAKGYPRPVGLHLYAGGPYPQGSVLTLTQATSLPGEAGVSRECGLGQGMPIRYRIELTATQIQRHAGKPIYIYGIHPSGDGNLNRLLGGSGFWKMPTAAPSPTSSPTSTPTTTPSPSPTARPASPSPMPSPTPAPSPTPTNAAGEILGGIDGIETSGGKRYIWGWACAKGATGAVGLHLYAGGPYPQGAVLSLTQRTSLPGEEGVSLACAIPLWNPIRYRIELTPTQMQQHSGKPIYVYGIHPSGNGSLNRLLGGSGYWRMPAP
ncbi:MAG: hypothetical protein NDJ89_01900 [Oligoflexia bacterium]|nr:hypothetical protein [Oligoflexia bacterium]